MSDTAGNLTRHFLTHLRTTVSGPHTIGSSFHPGSHPMGQADKRQGHGPLPAGQHRMAITSGIRTELGCGQVERKSDSGRNPVGTDTDIRHLAIPAQRPRATIRLGSASLPMGQGQQGQSDQLQQTRSSRRLQDLRPLWQLHRSRNRQTGSDPRPPGGFRRGHGSRRTSTLGRPSRPRRGIYERCRIDRGCIRRWIETNGATTQSGTLSSH